jgi:hypothetical protein
MLAGRGREKINGSAHFVQARGRPSLTAGYSERMRTQIPSSPQPLAALPAFTAAELDGALTLTLRGGEHARTLADADLPSGNSAAEIRSGSRAPVAPPGLTLTF